VKINRRGFLTISGLAVVGAFTKPVLDAFSVLGLPEKKLSDKAFVGEKWAMVINLRACSAENGCKDCIDVCHQIHNVPDFGNPKDEIKWIWTVPYEGAFPEQKHEFLEENLEHMPVTVLCNQCDNPPCVSVCPTRATWKSEDGIVMMDYHRCIGCRYCMAACPYGARSFNWRTPDPFIEKVDLDYPTRTRGVVEKCNFCRERLNKGLIPACVEACPEKALIFGDLEDPDSEVREVLRTHYSISRKPGLGTRPQVYYLV